MKLTKSQVAAYNETGFLIVENLFNVSEIQRLNTASKKFKEHKSKPNVICEDNGAIRSVFAPHTIFPEFDWIYKQERILNPIQQLIGDQVYLYQYKLNKKEAFNGQSWEWHQDFPFWHLDDGVAVPEMVSVMILFQDTHSYQGPLLFIPGSHKNGIAEFESKEHLNNKPLKLINSLNSDLKYTVKKDIIKKLALESGILSGEGSIGTCLFFHPNLFHASCSNLSPYSRDTAIITYNKIENIPLKKTDRRPEYVCSRDFSPIQAENTSLLGE